MEIANRPSIRSASRRRVVAAFASVILAACGGSDSTTPDVQEPDPGPQLTDLTIQVTISGTGGDQDGFVVAMVNTSTETPINLSLDGAGSVTFEALTRREYRLEVNELATHCVVVRGLVIFTPVAPTERMTVAIDCVGQVGFRDDSEGDAIYYLDETGAVITLIETENVLPAAWADTSTPTMMVTSSVSNGSFRDCRVRFASPGPSVTLVDDIQLYRPRWHAATNRLVASSNQYCLDGTLIIYDGSFNRVKELTTGSVSRVAWSPDGTRLAYHELDQVWIHEVEADTREVLYDVRSIDRAIDWSPDGTWVMMIRDYEDPSTPGEFRQRVLRVPVDGGDVVPLSPLEQRPSLAILSADGAYVAYKASVIGGPSGSEIYVVPSGGGAGTQLTSGGWVNTVGSWTPDGGHIFFTGTDGDLYRIPSSGGDPRLLRDCEQFCSYPVALGGQNPVFGAPSR